MTIVRIIVGLIQAILKACVAGFLAVVALGAVWAVGVAVVVGVLLVALFGFGGWRASRRNKQG